MKKDYETNISLPINYVNYPENTMPTKEILNSISLRIKGQGFNLINFYAIKNKLKINIDINNFSHIKTKHNNTIRIVVPSWRFVRQIEQQISSNVSLISMKPDSIYIELSKVANKTLAVKPNISYSIMRGSIKTSEKKISPDSVFIIGPQSILDTMTAVYTNNINIGELKESSNITIELKHNTNVRLSHNNVNIEIPIERHTEKRLSINPELINIPEKTNIKFWPNSINIQLNVALSKYSEISSSNIKAIADFSMADSITKTIPIIIGALPIGVEVVNISPSKLEYIIKK